MWRPRFPATTPGSEVESIRQRATRDTARVKKSWLARSIFLVVEITTLVTVEEVLVSANRPGVRVGVLTFLIFAVPFTAIGVVYVTQAWLAPYRQRRDARTRVPAEREEWRKALEREQETVGALRTKVAELEDRIANPPPPTVISIETAFTPRWLQDGALLLTLKLASEEAIPRESQLNLLSPASWGELVESDGLGRRIDPIGSPMYSEEDLTFWGKPLPALLWSHATRRDVRPRMAAVWHFRVSGAGEHPYPLKLYIDGFTMFSGLIEIPKKPGDGKRQQPIDSRLFYFSYASYGSGERQMSPLDRLNARIKKDKINFIVDNATMGGDPAPDELKTLMVRWVSEGEEFSSSFSEGTHVALPD